uniref:Uncharacterized protein n=1 Tax=Glossina pallidipes TaxID=7398 RepID=A0A1A9ZZA7_GLOPL
MQEMYCIFSALFTAHFWFVFKANAFNSFVHFAFFWQLMCFSYPLLHHFLRIGIILMGVAFFAFKCNNVLIDGTAYVLSMYTSVMLLVKSICKKSEIPLKHNELNEFIFGPFLYVDNERFLHPMMSRNRGYGAALLVMTAFFNKYYATSRTLQHITKIPTICFMNVVTVFVGTTAFLARNRAQKLLRFQSDLFILRTEKDLPLKWMIILNCASERASGTKEGSESLQIDMTIIRNAFIWTSSHLVRIFPVAETVVLTLLTEVNFLSDFTIPRLK